MKENFITNFDGNILEVLLQFSCYGTDMFN